MRRRKLMTRDPDFQVPRAPAGLETDNPLTDGYTVTNRARQCWDGSYRMPSSAECDEPDYSGIEASSFYYHDED